MKRCAPPPLISTMLLAVAACTEQSTAPGVCPDFCPGAQIESHDTLFTIIERDSSFRGYLQAYQGEAMTATDLPGVVDSRPFFRTDTMFLRIQAKVGDTTTVPKVVDSLRVRLVVVRRPKNTTELRLRLYRLPVTVDSTFDFAALDPYFQAAPVDSVNISHLLGVPGATDTVTTKFWSTVCPTCIDSVRVDSDENVLLTQADSTTLLVYVKLDTLQAPLSEADSGRLAFGVRVAADSLASVTLGATGSIAGGPLVRWFYHYTIPDTVSTTPDSVVANDKVVPTTFDSFVFDPPSAAIDSNLTVGGVPSARALIRVAMPKFLHDSIDVVRATLLLVPVGAIPGVPSDSFYIVARPVLGDLGAKSPVNLDPRVGLADSAFMHIASTDTMRLELTKMVRAWSLDTSLVTTFVLGQVPEATSYAQARFYSTRAPAFRPALRVTYVSRYKFGLP